MSLLDNLPHTATAKRRRRTRGSRSGTKDTYPTTIFTDKACWQQSAKEREIKEYDKDGISVTHKVYFNEDPGLTQRHILEVTATDGNGVTTTTTLEVRTKAAPDASAGLGVLWRVMAEQTTTGSTS